MSQYPAETTHAQTIHGRKFGANDRPFPLRSVMDGNVHLFLDDGYERNDPRRPKSGRAQIERALRRRARDGGQVFYALDEGAARPWRNADGKQFVPPDPEIALRPWGEEEDRRLAVFRAELEERMVDGGSYRPMSPLAAQTTAALEAKAEAAAASEAEAAVTTRGRGGRARRETAA